MMENHTAALLWFIDRQLSAAAMVINAVLAGTSAIN